MKTLIIVACCTSLGWAEMCWKKTPEGVRQEIACESDTAKYVSDEVAPGKGHQPDWETGIVKVSTSVQNMSESDRKADEFVAKETAAADSNGKKPK